MQHINFTDIGAFFALEITLYYTLLQFITLLLQEITLYYKKCNFYFDSFYPLNIYIL